jgi:predicted RNA binding protein YcfA (HicA-like mRNA interferase family)
MSTHPSITFTELIQKVQKFGFQKVRQKGSHIRFVHPDGRKTTIPDHGHIDVPKGLFNKIIRHDLELTIDQFWNYDL